MKDFSHFETRAELFQTDLSYAAELLVKVVRDSNTDT